MLKIKKKDSVRTISTLLTITEQHSTSSVPACKQDRDRQTEEEMDIR